MNDKNADPIKGKTVRWTYADGPMKGKGFEHRFAGDGTVSWTEAGDPPASTAAVKDAQAAEQHATGRYQAARLNDGVYVVSYLAGSGWTLTTVVDEKTGKIVSFASNEKELVIQHGELDRATARAT
jgi:hypothetical protein